MSRASKLWVAGIVGIAALASASCADSGTISDPPPPTTSATISTPPTVPTTPATEQPDDLPSVVEIQERIERALPAGTSVSWEPGLRTNCGPTDALLAGNLLLGTATVTWESPEAFGTFTATHDRGAQSTDDYVVLNGDSWTGTVSISSRDDGTVSGRLDISAVVADAPLPAGYTTGNGGCG